MPFVSPVIQYVVGPTGTNGLTFPSRLTRQWVVPAGGLGKVSPSAPSLASPVGAVGVAGVVSTATVGFDDATVEPAPLVAVSAKRRYWPRSAMLGTYVGPVVDVALHVVDETASVHRYQRPPVDNCPDPDADRHVPAAAVRVWPTCAVPVTVGLVMSSGAVTTGSSTCQAPPKYGEESSAASWAAADASLSMR